MKTTLFLGSLQLLLATCAGGPAVSSEAEKQLAEARRQLDAGDPDAALAITDELRRVYPAWTDVFVVAGDGNLALARIERRGLDPRNVYGDAETCFLRATELDPARAEGWLGLAKARYGLGDWEPAREAAATAIERSKSTDGLAPKAAVVAGQACQQQVVALRQAELQSGTPDQRGVVPIEADTLQKAQQALGYFALAQSATPGEACRGAALVYQWIDQSDEAMRELERGIALAPENAELHVAFQDLHVQLGQQRALGGAYTRLVRELPGQPILLWFAGRAEVVQADQLRSRQNLQPAIEGYRKAAAHYLAYAAKVPGHRDTANQWVAICELSIARAAADMGDTTAAKEHLFAAAEASPMAVQYEGMEPALRDSFGSHFAGVVFVVGRALSASVDQQALEQTVAFYDEVIARYPGRWGFVYNNAALPCRDLGVLLVRDVEKLEPKQREAAMTAAMALWEKSYRYYEEAVKLSPQDARIVNDCGLMLIYHLDRDFDRAKQLFEQAIAAGQPQLDAMPKDAPKEERQLLEEAVGDAWQNLAVLALRHQHRPFAEAKPFLDKAVLYYPYMQREAAHMLANQGQDSGKARLNPRSLQGATNASAEQGGEKEKLQELRKKAEEAAQGGDLDGALAELDKGKKDLKDYGPYHALCGDYALRYARQAIAEGRRGADMLLQDAAATLQRAVQLDSEPAAPRLMLAEAQYEAGQLDMATRTISALLLHVQSQGGGDATLVASAHRLRANAAARAFMADPKGKEAKPMLDEARLSFRQLETKKLLDSDLRKTWSTMETWAEAGAEAVGVYARMLKDAPDDMAAIAAVVDTAYAAGEPTLAVDALKDRKDGAGLWYLGRARFLAASSQRALGKLDDALAELDRAIATFEESKKAKADFADSCDQWIAICLGKQGNALVAKKDWAGAEKKLLASIQKRPDRLNDDLGLQETTKIGLMFVADHFAQAGDLGNTERIYRAATAVCDNDLDLLNNEGLFARDHANRLERDGKQKEAMELYEQSYKAYSRAAQLDDKNVRLLNDRALIAIHYLERDWDENKTVLDRAIELGEQQLKDFPAGDADGRRKLDEALGDAYENLALWHLKHGGDAAAAKAAAEKSMGHHPGSGRPGARRHLAEAEQKLKEPK